MPIKNNAFETKQNITNNNINHLTKGGTYA